MRTPTILLGSSNGPCGVSRGGVRSASSPAYVFFVGGGRCESDTGSGGSGGGGGSGVMLVPLNRRRDSRFSKNMAVLLCFVRAQSTCARHWNRAGHARHTPRSWHARGAQRASGASLFPVDGDLIE